MYQRFALLWLLCLSLGACVPVAIPEEPSPYNLVEPFLGAWRGADDELGAPRTPPLWIDDFQVQFFARHLIRAVDSRRAFVEPLAPNWESNYPSDLLDRPASPLRASLTLTERVHVLVAPLDQVSIVVRIPGYSGPAELRLYDVALRPTGSSSFEVVDGLATVAVVARGRLGPQWAMALVDGQLAGIRQALFTLDAQTLLQTGDTELDPLYPRLQALMAQAAISYQLNGRTIRGYRSPDNPLLWLRDHVYQGRGFRYFENDLTTTLDAFRDAQLPNGSLPDVLDYPERFVTAFRKEVESDLEFLYVQGVYEAWQATGDDSWLQTHLEPMRRALTYITSDPLRWDATRGLVRRPYTIDMWDFSYGPTTISPDGKPAPRHWIDADTIWGTFHGDNSGLAYALELMARMEKQLGEPERAAAWHVQRRALIDRLNQLSWNGSFFTHFVPEDPKVRPTGVDPLRQLSLSNAYALNREILDLRQGRAIVEAYFARRAFDRAFAEWYAIDPPFPAGSFGMAGGKGENPGEYTNGGIMPLVGGELARGAFRFGAEPYGFDILRRYAALTRLTGASYLWYYPDGRPGIQGPNTIPTDGWGAGAMIGALFEGAAGFSDYGSRFAELQLSPRWSAEAGFRDVRATVRYAASDGYAAYHWRREANTLRLSLTSSAAETTLRLLLPAEAVEQSLQVILDGKAVPARVELLLNSSYLLLTLPGGDAEIVVRW